MTTLFYQVRKGLSVIDSNTTNTSKASIDGATGDIVTDGSLQLSGDIKNSSSNVAITLGAGATPNVTITNDLIVNGGDLTLKGSSSGQTTFSAPATGSTLTYVLPSAGGAANTVLTNDGSGNLSWALPGGGGSTFGNITVGVVTDNTISTTTGDLILDSATNTVSVDADLTTPLTTFNLLDTTATTVNAFGAATTIDIGASTGYATFGTNIVKGAIRSPIVSPNVYAYGTGGNTFTGTGLSIDNSLDTAKRPNIVMRSYGISGGAPRNPYIGEAARGTAASPTKVLNNDNLIEFQANGYYDDGAGNANWYNNASSLGTMIIRGRAKEAVSGQGWNSTANAGMDFQILLQPGAGLTPTANTYVQNTFDPVYDAALSRQGNEFKSDRHVFASRSSTQGGSNFGNQVIINDTGIQVLGNNIIASDGNTNITLTSNTLTAFAGDIRVNGNDIQASDGNTNITLTSNTLTAFAGDIKIGGNDIQASDGNTAITLEPVASYNPNTQIVANLFKGDIRSATTEAAGDVWTQGTTGYRGISVDNSQNTAKRPGYIMRGYSGGASAPRTAFVGETARGTAASPVRLSTNDNMIEFWATGYYDNGSGSAGWMADANVAPGMIMRARASENWLGASNMGTEFQILLTPNGVTQTSGGGAYNNSLVLNPTAGNQYRSDSHYFYTRSPGAGGTNLTQLTIDSSGNLVAAGYLQTNTGEIKISGGSTKILMDSTNNRYNNPYHQFRNPSASFLSQIYFNIGDGTFKTEFGVQSYSSDGSKQATTNWSSYRFDGTNLSATQSGDVLGEFKFNGNTATSGTAPSVPGGPGGNVYVIATENWTNTANGTKMEFSAIKKGTLTSYAVFSADPEAAAFKSDSFTFQNTAGSTLLTIDNSGNVDIAGDLTVGGSTVYDYTAYGDGRLSTTSTSLTTLDSWATATYQSAGYQITVKDTVTGDVQVTRIDMFHAAGTAYINQFSNMTSAADLATFSATISGGNAVLEITPASTNNTQFTFSRTLTAV